MLVVSEVLCVDVMTLNLLCSPMTLRLLFLHKLDEGVSLS